MQSNDCFSICSIIRLGLTLECRIRLVVWDAIRQSLWHSGALIG